MTEAGKSILVHTEQGMGDAIQFFRLLLQRKLLNVFPLVLRKSGVGGSHRSALRRKNMAAENVKQGLQCAGARSEDQRACEN